MGPNPIEIRLLASQHERLCRMVRALVGDEHRAEDMVQEAWVRALENGPKEPGALGAWLGTVTRRLAYNDRRGQGRRDQRERTAARDEAVPSSAEIAERVEIQTRVLTALESLDEPHRTTLRDRYLGELTPAEIARRDGVSLNTIKSRLTRARAAMRERLDRDGLGGDVHWSILVGPLLTPLGPGAAPNGHSGATQSSGQPSPSAATPAATLGSMASQSLAGASVLGGALVMKKALVLAIVLIIGTVTWQMATGRKPEAAQPAALTPVDARAPAGLELADPHVLAANEAGARVEVDSLDATSTAPLVGSAGSWLVAGRARDPREDKGVRGVAFDLAVYAGYGAEGEPLFEERLVSGDDGRFELALEDPGRTVTITVDSPDTDERVVVTYGPHVVVAGDSAPKLNALVFPIDGRLVGRVSDVAGNPVEGCTVKGLYGQAETAVDGRYEMSIATGAWGKITATASGFGGDSLELEGLKPGATTVANFTLGGAIRIEGVVRAASGVGIAGARVEGSGTVRDRTDTDRAGRYVLNSVAHVPGEKVWVSVRAEGFGWASQAVEIEVDPREYQQDFELVRGVPVTGLIVAPDGTPVPGAEVWIGAQRDAWDGSTGLSDDDGRFAFDSVPPGRTQAGGEKEGFAPATTVFTVPEHGRAGELLLRFPVARTVRGVVRDEAGQPLPGVSVAARQNFDYVGSSGRSNELGEFEVTDLPEGMLSMEAFARGLVRTHVSVAANEGDVVIEVARSGRIAGRVVDAATGAPLPSFTVRFVMATDPEAHPRVESYGASWSEPGRTFHDDGGGWSTDEYDELRLGAWLGVEVRAEGYAPAVRTVQIIAADAESELVHELVQPITLELVLSLEGSGLPVSDAAITATTLSYVSQEDLRWNATTDATGRAVLDEVSPGPLYVTVTPADGAPRRLGPFEVAASPARSVLAIELPAGRTVEITLLDHVGDALPDQTVVLSATIEGSGRMTLKGVTDKAGVLRIEGVPIGSWQASRILWDGIRACNDLTGHLEVTESDEVARLELRPPGETTVRGTILADGPLPLGCTIAALSRDGAPNHGAFVREGLFELRGLASGSYLVTISYWDPVSSMLVSGHAELRVQEGDLELPLEVVMAVQER